MNSCHDEWNDKNSIDITQVPKKYGISEKIIRSNIDKGKIKTKNDKLLLSDLEKIENQRKTFIGLKEYMNLHNNEMFDAKYYKHRDKFIDFLEINDYFGVELFDEEDIIFELPGKEEYYIKQDKIDELDKKCKDFFKYYGLTEKEKVEKIIKTKSHRKETINYIKEYIERYKERRELYTPAFTTFVNIILSIPEVTDISDEELKNIIEKAEIKQTKAHIVDYFNMVSSEKGLKNKKASVKKGQKIIYDAYPYEVIVKLAEILFNEEYSKKHSLINKALDKSKYAEMWLFISLHYVCGWRAKDICEKWVYLELSDEKNHLDINIENIKEDILNDRIKEDTYRDITLYSLEKLEMNNVIPSKTHRYSAGKLRAMITPDLRVFFGKLMLIAEYHHHRNQEGYMKRNRVSTYTNWLELKNFFGEEIQKLFGRFNLSSRRLNKSYLQAIEKNTRETGNTNLMSHMIASYARNHIDINTTAIYLRDHGLSGESANVVLYMMMQRGVMGMYLYQLLVLAFPNEFKKLAMKEQTYIMEKISPSAYELEKAGALLCEVEKLEDSFETGNAKNTMEILKIMYEIGQGKGKGKDEGIYCKRRALGMICENPKYESCMANMCPYFVFTSEAIPSLVEVIKRYAQKKDSTEKNKYKYVLKKMIIPGFQDIINEIIKDMKKKEKQIIRKLIEDGVDE